MGARVQLFNLYRKTLCSHAAPGLREKLDRHFGMLLRGLTPDLSGRSLSVFIRRMFAVARECKGKL